MPMISETDVNKPFQPKILNSLSSWLIKGNNKTNNNTITNSSNVPTVTSPTCMTSTTTPSHKNAIPWTYKWSNNSCAYDCIITVLGNIYKEYNENNKHIFSLFFPTLTVIFESLITKDIDLNKAKSQWITLFDPIYKQTEFQSLYNVWNHLLTLTNNYELFTFQYVSISQCLCNTENRYNGYYKIFELNVCNHRSKNVQERLNDIFVESQRFYSHICSTCKSLKKITPEIASFPKLLCISDNVISENIRKSFEINTDIYIYNVTSSPKYTLKAVIYYSPGHYTVRMNFNNYSYEYDGMSKNWRIDGILGNGTIRRTPMNKNTFASVHSRNYFSTMYYYVYNGNQTNFVNDLDNIADLNGLTSTVSSTISNLPISSVSTPFASNISDLTSTTTELQLNPDPTTANATVSATIAALTPTFPENTITTVERKRHKDFQCNNHVGCTNNFIYQDMDECECDYLCTPKSRFGKYYTCKEKVCVQSMLQHESDNRKQRKKKK